MPAAAIVFALATSLSMASPAPIAPCSVPELIIRWAPVLMVSVELALALMVPLLTSVRWASPIVPAPVMVLPALVSVAALPLVTMALSALFDRIALPPPDKVSEPSSSSCVGFGRAVQRDRAGIDGRCRRVPASRRWQRSQRRHWHRCRYRSLRRTFRR